MSYPALCRELRRWRHDPDADWLLEMPIHPLQKKLKDLCQAFANHEEGPADAPRFKKKGRECPDSLRVQRRSPVAVTRNPPKPRPITEAAGIPARTDA